MPRLGFLLPAFGAILMAVLWVAVLDRIDNEREEVIRLNTAAAVSYAKIFEERVVRVLSQIEQFAESAELELQTGSGVNTLRRIAGTHHAALADVSMRVLVLDREGRPVSSGDMGQTPSQMNREYVASHNEKSDVKLNVGQPLLDPSTLRWVIPVTLRLTFADGVFAGVAVITVDPSFLTAVYDKSALGVNGSMTLIGSDGVVRARRVGDKVFATPLRDQHSAFSKAGLTRDTATVASPFDTVTRIQSYRRLNGYPLIAVVGISDDELTEGMAAARLAYLAFAIVAALLIAAVVGLMSFQNRVLVRSQRRAETLAATLDASGDFVISIFPDGTVFYANPAARRLLHILGEEAKLDFKRFFPSWAFERIITIACPAAKRDGHWVGESAILSEAGEVPMSHMVIAHKGPDGVVNYYSNIMRDISDAKRVESALRNSEGRLRRVTDRLPMRIAFIDAQQRIQLSNTEYERGYRSSADGVKGKTVRELAGDTAYAELEPYIHRALKGETVTFDQERNTRVGYFCSRTTFTPELDDAGEVLGFQLMEQDLTVMKLEERRLLQLSEMDALTGLANRVAFERALAAAMERARQQGSLLAVMYLDIDYFKRINDSYGHLIGDSLLKDFGKRLVNSVRSFDIVARMGGDEFTILLMDLPHAEAASSVAAKVIASMTNPFVEEQHVLAVTTSIGVALYRGAPTTASELLRQADLMLYSAKSGGRNRYCMTAESDTGAVVESKTAE